MAGDARKRELAELAWTLFVGVLAVCVAAADHIGSVGLVVMFAGLTICVPIELRSREAPMLRLLIWTVFAPIGITMGPLFLWLKTIGYGLTWLLVFPALVGVYLLLRGRQSPIAATSVAALMAVVGVVSFVAGVVGPADKREFNEVPSLLEDIDPGLRVEANRVSSVLGLCTAAVLIAGAVQRRPRRVQISGAESGTRVCPFCAEEIKAAAVKCRFCGETVEAAQA